MIRLSALVVPNSSPAIAATRSNSAIATSPQLSPPTISSPSVVKSSAFTLFLPSLSYFCPENVQSRPVFVKALYKFRTIGLVSRHPQLRIGELSRRTGVAPELLRAWERRYGLLRPQRSEGGFRLYSGADERRVELMRLHPPPGFAPSQTRARAR